MNDSAIEQLRTAINDRPANGLVDWIAAILKICQDNDLKLTWQNKQIRVRGAGSDTEEVIEDSLPRPSVFRAALARIAALCNEERSNSVSPYGGKGSFSVGGDRTKVLQVDFVNTQAEQRLELASVARGAEQQMPSTQEGWVGKTQKGDGRLID